MSVIRRLRRQSCLLVVLLGLWGCDHRPSVERAPPAQLRLGSVLGETSVEGFQRAEAPRRFVFPQDHGPHPGFRSEWWYLTAVLADPEGSDFGVQFTLFRQALGPDGASADNRWQTPQVYLAHFAVTDGTGGDHRAAERYARGHPDLAGVQTEPFALWLEDWRLEETGGAWQLSASMEDVSVALSFEVPAPIVLQGAAAEPGLSRKGPGQASYYYSMPRIPAAGQITIDGRVSPVSGYGWLDREWSTSVLSGGQVGWDWFALQLDDGRSLMVFQLRRRDGGRDPYDQGMLIEPDGEGRHLTTADFRLEPDRFWRDDADTLWPVGWSLQLGEEELRLVAVLDDQLMDTSVRYWEGMVAVLNEAGERTGSGYMELTGYADMNGDGET